MIANDAHDSTAAAKLTSSLLSSHACDVHPRHSTATVPGKPPKAVTALLPEGNVGIIYHYFLHYECRVT